MSSILFSRKDKLLRGKNQMENNVVILKSPNPEREAGGFIAFLTRFFQVPFVKNEKDRVTVRITGGVFVFEKDSASNL